MIFRATLSLAFALLVMSAISAQVFVDINATGANDGTSWQNAYTSFRQASIDAPEGSEIWVAAGVYRGEPGGSSFAFNLSNDHFQVYGGFAGGEATRNERNPRENLTILSGDVLGDDIPGDLETNRDDNFAIVVQLFGSDPAILDGFIIEGAGGAELSPAGGGITIGWRETVQNCLFRDNKAVSGGAVAAADLRTPPSGTLTQFINCQFENNQAEEKGGAVYSDGFQFNPSFADCVFQNNNAIAGGALYIQDSVLIFRCLFDANSADSTGGAIHSGDFLGNSLIAQSEFSNNRSFGGGAMLIDFSDVSLSKCSFISNTAEDGGAIQIVGSGGIIMDSTMLRMNTANNWGGGLQISGGFAVLVSDCLFEENTALIGGAVMNIETFFDLVDVGSTYRANSAIRGGAYYAGDDMVINGVNFESNEAEEFGGAMMTFGIIRALECNFMNNSASGATGTGGALAAFTVSRGDVSEIQSCTFTDNQANVEGGAIYLENNDLVLSDSKFQDNTVPGGNYGYGGAISAFNVQATTELMLSADNCEFLRNEARDGGGAIVFTTDGISDTTSTISNSIFRGNRTSGWGGAINGYNTSYDVISCEFLGNEAVNGGAVIQPNEYDAFADTIRLINCSAAENGMTSSIALWRDMGDNTTVTLQNTILGDEFAYEFREGEALTEVEESGLVSLGGNLAASDLSTHLVHPSDQNAIEPSFIDPSVDLQLSGGSPAIDAGVDEGAPETDILGLARVGTTDAGAYEFGGVTGIFNSVTLENIEVFPNPTSDRITIDLPSELKAQSFMITGMNGRSNETWTHELRGQEQLIVPVINLMPGNYMITIKDGDRFLGAKFQVIR